MPMYLTAFFSTRIYPELPFSSPSNFSHLHRKNNLSRSSPITFCNFSRSMRTERSSVNPEKYNWKKSSKMSNFGALLLSDPNLLDDDDEYYDEEDKWTSNASASSTSYYPSSAEASPYVFSPLNVSSPFSKSPWIIPSQIMNPFDPKNGLVGSLIREEGHVYSLAVSGDLLYTGSDSKNVRVWKNLKEFSGFKSNSGLVKAIVVSDDRVFTGHQDGKIRVWRLSGHTGHKRIGTMPSFKNFVKCSLNPSNYIQTRRHKKVVWIRHYDAVSCLTMNDDQSLLYSGSWDKTLKVWRVSDLKCIESVEAHDDAINAVASDSDGLVFTGSADGTVKAWRRELHGRSTKHFLVQLLLKQNSAVTSLAVDDTSRTVYCGSSDGLVNFWEGVKRLSHGGALKGHKMAVLCLATGGSLVFSGSADKSICVWRREHGGVHTCLSVLTGHAGPVKCIASQKDESSEDRDRWWTVYSGSLDRSVKVWRVSENPANYLPMKEYNSPVDNRDD